MKDSLYQIMLRRGDYFTLFTKYLELLMVYGVKNKDNTMLELRNSDDLDNLNIAYQILLNKVYKNVY